MQPVVSYRLRREIDEMFLKGLRNKLEQVLVNPTVNLIEEELIGLVLKEMKSKARPGTAGLYIPSYYRVFVKRGVTNLDINKVKRVVGQKIRDDNLKVRRDLKFDIKFRNKQEDDLIVESKFIINDGDLEQTKGGETRVFKSNLSKEFSSEDQINQTIKVKPLSERKALLKLVENNVEIKSFTITAVETNIGRQEHNEIVLSDSKVSRVHAQIIKKDYYYLINDLNSTNGIFVNGQLIKSKRLVDGDRIRLGNSELEFSLKL